MKRRIQKQTAGIGVIVVLVILVWSLILFRQQQESLPAMAMEDQEQEETFGMQEEAESEEGTDYVSLEELLGSRYLTIRKTRETSDEMTLSEDFLHNRLELLLLGSEGSFEETNDWIAETTEKIEAAGSFVEGVEAFYETKKETLSLSITFDHLYVPFLYEDEAYYYLALKRPREVYDRIVVIDAGHGGKHPGTMSPDKDYAEKDINLAIALELKNFLDTREDIKVYYTRLEDETVYLRPRVTLANEAEADCFISIHSNAFWNSNVHGTEVLYREEELSPKGTIQSRTGITSKQLASICLEEVTSLLQTNDRGIWKDEETYILKHAQVPAALIEVAFLTNEEDLKLLCEPESQKQAAKGIYEAILKLYEKEDGGEP